MHGGFRTATVRSTKFSDFKADDTRKERAQFSATLRTQQNVRHAQDDYNRATFPAFFRSPTGK